ncbi:MAG: DUF2062 domain-containing protein [Myxococcales bacterium]|nr:DUF2062 domain-containing protein [Myxococcales bacterium]
MRWLWKRLKEVVVHRILGVDDTPHRIAWGVFIGTVIAWTPTLGFQMMLYFACATLLRANKISGMPILFISNPFTAVPVYYFAYRVGSVVLHGRSADTAVARAQIAERLRQAAEVAGTTHWWQALGHEAFWATVGHTMLALGVELWLGSFVIGFAMGAPLYFVTRWGVRLFRRASPPRHSMPPSR